MESSPWRIANCCLACSVTSTTATCPSLTVPSPMCRHHVQPNPVQLQPSHRCRRVFAGVAFTIKVFVFCAPLPSKAPSRVYMDFWAPDRWTPTLQKEAIFKRRHTLVRFIHPVQDSRPFRPQLCRLDQLSPSVICATTVLSCTTICAQPSTCSVGSTFSPNLSAIILCLISVLFSRTNRIVPNSIVHS